MSSDLYGPDSSSPVLPRRRREPRKLNYDKCTFCRHAKVRCIPERRSWPEQKCSRCAEKMFPCSAPQRKGPAPESFTQGSQTLPAPPSETSEKEPVSPSGTKDALLLLSLHNILRLVIEEVRALAEEFLSPFKHDSAWKVHLREADSVFSHYDQILQTVSNQLMGLSKVEARAVIEATLDITNCNVAIVASNERIDASILKYEKERHFGVAYALLMQQMTKHPSIFDLSKSRFLRYRRKFFDDCLRFCERLDTADMEGLRSFISIPQPYISKQLLSVLTEKQKSVLLQWNQDDKDCLGRSLSHFTHDGTMPSHSYPQWQSTDYMQADLLGRIPIHLACLRGDYELFDQLDPGPGMLNAECLGLRNFDIATIKRDRRIIMKIALYIRYRHYASKQRGPTKRNCLHWAASCGHLEAVKDLCCWLSTGLDDIINVRDYLGDTPIHLAARFGHTEIVRYLLRFVDWNIMNYPYDHSPFFSAVTGGHIAIMEILHPHSNIDKFDDFRSSEDTSALSGGRRYRLTPLAEAARQGFTAGVRYLLKFNQAVPGTVNPNSMNEIGDLLPQTPLDIALSHHHDDCIAILKLHGARRLLVDLTAPSDDEDDLVIRI